ncbi:chaperone protein DnaJ 2-like [Anopheles merus]|uniref:chaperone protein DnaJ 2-like n=1 Tax=Anopheles merus TaxID=30066 RepID=UPI001BE3DE44|nr:chaperone protein DnaJ 2-like [Anopheles merus]
MEEEKNLYVVLGVAREASLEEILAAYQRLAPMCREDSENYDPTDFPIQGLEQQEYWELLNHAYRTLIIPEMRARYDAGYPSEELPAPVRSRAESLALGSSAAIQPPPLIVPASEQVRPHSIVLQCPVQLEELFYGTRKDVSYQRLVNIAGQSELIYQTTSVNITPYMRDGEQIILRGLGNQIGAAQGDLLVVLRQFVHPSFSAKGNDLVCNCHIPLSVAVLGGIVVFRGIDNKTFRLMLDEPYPLLPPLVKVIEGEGMKTRHGRGKLVVKFYVQFLPVPTRLRDETANLLRQIEGAFKRAEDAYN